MPRLRLRTKRFVLPTFRSTAYSGLDYTAVQRLSDFDKVFAMLDGKAVPDVPLAHVVQAQKNSLLARERLSSSYFDVRYFSGTQTMHFFPTRQDLVERLNRIVGRHRNWLPPVDEKSGDNQAEAFWSHYAQAEKMDADVRKALAEQYAKSSTYAESALYGLIKAAQVGYQDDAEKARQQEDMARAIESVAATTGQNVLAFSEPVPVKLPLAA